MEDSEVKQAQWLRISPECAERDLYIATAYVRPVGSARTVTQWATDAEDLFQDVEHLRSKGYTVLIGADMNGRVGRALDDDDKAPMWGEQASNEQGRCLVDHLHEQDLHLLHNRTPPTCFTCIRAQGSSAVDYLISTGDLLPCAHTVHTFYADPDTTDHALPSVDVKLKTKRSRQAQKTRAAPCLAPR